MTAASTSLRRESFYLSGMREAKPEACWRIIDNGERVCILDRGHDNGVHESGVTYDELLAENEQLRAKLAEYDKYVAEFTNHA